MTIISEPITDVSLGGDGAEIVFYLNDPRAKSSGSGIISVKRVPVKPANGVLTTPHLDPGPARVRWGTKSFPIVIPFADGDTPVRLWPLIEAGVTPADAPVVNAAVAAKNLAVQAAIDAAVARDEAVAAAQTSGKSAYEIAVLNGYAGTESQWLATLEGPQGDSAFAVAVDAGFVGTQAQWLESLVSTEPGPEGPRGVGIAIEQQVNTYADLPATATDNFGVLVKADGKLYVYDGGWPDDGDGVQIVGPQGAGYIAEDPENPGHFLFESAPSVEAAAAAALSGAEAFWDESANSAAEAAVSRTAADDAAALAGTHADTAADEADTATAQAVIATTKAGEASSAAITANTAATDAAASEAAAQEWAEQAGEAVSTGIPDATTTVKGGIILDGDLGGTFDAPTVPGLADKEDTADKGAANGYAPLDGASKVPAANLPTTDSVTEGTTNKYFTDARAQAALAAALGDKAPKASPTFTGTVETPALKVTGGSPAVGKVMGVDASGNVTAQTPSLGPITSPLTPGMYHRGIMVGGANTTKLLTASQVTGLRIVPGRSCTLTSLGVNITTAGSSGAVIRLGVYEIDMQARTAALVGDFGTVAGTATGSFTASGTAAVVVGKMYWLIAVAQGGPTTQPTIKASSANDGILGDASADTVLTVNITGFYSSTTVAGALPSTLPLSVTGNPIPLVVALAAS